MFEELVQWLATGVHNVRNGMRFGGGILYFISMLNYSTKTLYHRINHNQTLPFAAITCSCVSVYVRYYLTVCFGALLKKYNFSAVEEFPSFYGILPRTQEYTLTPYLFMNHFNIIFTSAPRSAKWPVPFRCLE